MTEQEKLDMEKELKETLAKDADVLKINCDLLLKAFDKLDPESRFKEFSKMAIAYSIVRRVIDMVKELGEDGFTEVLDNEFVRDVFHVISTFNAVGVELGYAQPIKEGGK